MSVTMLAGCSIHCLNTRLGSSSSVCHIQGFAIPALLQFSSIAGVILNYFIGVMQLQNSLEANGVAQTNKRVSGKWECVSELRLLLLNSMKRGLSF